MKNFIEKFSNISGVAWGVAVLAFLVGLWIGLPADSETDHGTSKMDENVSTWTCSMHPSVNLPESGKCPICFMDLIPVANESGTVNVNEITLSADAQVLAAVETAPIKRGKAIADIPISGKVDFDETRIKSITAWFPGRIERLFVDFTGVSVIKGDPLVELYSPELYSAQEEFLQGIKLQGLSFQGSQLDLIPQASRHKLQLLGLTDDQINEIEKRNTSVDKITITSPISGVVTAKSAVAGQYVKTGSKLFDVVGLERVWVLLDVYESDLTMIRIGQRVTFTTKALPGHEFTGSVAFIDPFLNEKTRTARVRVNVDNRSGLLKPGMFTNGNVKVDISNDGIVYSGDLVGKWVCPMHLGERSNHTGRCSICEMELEAVESLKFTQGCTDNNPLLVPVSAVLRTGRRAIVYVQTAERTFASREVLLGPRAGNYYIVKSGLREGERIVVKGNFKIDSAMQIAAKPSMMNPNREVNR